MIFFFENLKQSIVNKMMKLRDEAQRVQAYRVSGSYRREWKAISIRKVSAGEVKITTKR